MQPPTAAAGVVEQLRERILSGALRPGMALPPERALAGELAVSRATLREGLSTLSQMGLVSIQRGRGGGAVITAPPASTVSSSIALLFQTRAITAGQLAEFRRALEIEAAHLAASRRTEADLDSMAGSLAAYAGTTDIQTQSEQGRAFHHAIARASGNPLLAETMASLNDAFAESLEMMLHVAPDREDVILALHQPILDAIRAGDATAARQHMQIHFDHLFAVFAAQGFGDHQLEASAGPSLVNPGAPRWTGRG
ncbi:MAG: FadR family transcriptional regulator [Thermomicrobiales bacterium]|nr:FadR family transcriptional regulator [Thermomicrobiales bacterium]